jgi:flavin reductase (DIM6/NTAB) family NADH-FMN oxidoreductase RutF
VIINPESLNPGRRYFLMISCIIPRPIAWAGTVNEDGSNNLAPFSFFNGMSSTPPVVAIGFAPHEDKGQKDTLRNVLRTGEIAVSIPSRDLADKVSATSEDLTYGADEFVACELTPYFGGLVNAPLVREARVALECSLLRHIEFGDAGSSMVLAEIRAFHLDDRLIDNRGTVNPNSLQPLARLGGGFFTTLGEVFKPGQN